MLRTDQLPLAYNMIDAAMAYAAPLCRGMLNQLAQGGDRAYRQTLLPVYEAHIAQPETALRGVVTAISLVCLAARRLPTQSETFVCGLDDDALMDLCLFFIARAVNMKTPGSNPTTKEKT